MSYVLQSIATTQSMSWYCYILLQWYSNSKTSFIFLQIRAQILTKKFKCTIFHLSLFSKLSRQQQSFHKPGHPFLIPHVSLFMSHTLINHAQNCYLLLLSLQKQRLSIHNMLHKHVQKTCIILKTHKVPPPLIHCNHTYWNSK